LFIFELSLLPLQLPNLKIEKMSTFRELLVWQKSMALVTEIYQLTNAFPKEEVYSLTSQIRRSGVSIPSNIAEGYGRNGTKDYLRFLNIAIASLFEMQTQIEIAYNLKYINEIQFNKIFEESREVERMMGSFIRKINERI
jgi:four helix bundle protein